MLKTMWDDSLLYNIDNINHVTEYEGNLSVESFIMIAFNNCSLPNAMVGTYGRCIDSKYFSSISYSIYHLLFNLVVQ